MRMAPHIRAWLVVVPLAASAAPAAALGFLGARVDPPTLAPLAAGSQGTLRVLALGSGDANPGVTVCGPAGVTFGAVHNDPINMPPLVGTPQGPCITVTGVGLALPGRLYALDFPFTFQPSVLPPL